MRPIYLARGQYPRSVRNDSRSETWSWDNLEDLPQREQWHSQNVLLGHIPQVRHTYALIEGVYGILNEKQVAMGESTCASKLYAAPLGPSGGGKGKAMMDISELSQIAMERSSTAREAIQMMGELATTYGFYSADWDDKTFGVGNAMGEGGEALTVTDPEEAWVFHITPDPTGASAIWVAQRVPDSHISVVANTFVIRKVDPDSEDFMYSKNLWSVAKEKGWWAPKDGLLDFLVAYSPERYHPNYSNRRVWRVLSLAAPSANLSPFTDDNADDYPFSIEVDSLLGEEDLMRFQRDHYEGTQFSTAEGMAAGPYGNPNRYDGGANGDMTKRESMDGEFPRDISLFRTIYSFVTKSRRDTPDVLSMLWVCQYAPDLSAYVPMYVEAERLSKAWITGSALAYNSDSAWWNFCVAGNYVSQFYSFAIKAIRDMQHKLQTQYNQDVKDVESTVRELLHDVKDSSSEEKSRAQAKVTALLTDFTVSHGDDTMHAWRNMIPHIWTTYRDGYVFSGFDQTTVSVQRMFYPEWWLQQVGYFNPMNLNHDKDAILFATDPASVSSEGASGSTFSTSFLPLVSGLVVGMLAGKYLARRESDRNGYSAIPSSIDRASAL